MVEKPAIVMNEAAFKMLLDALTGSKTDNRGGASNEIEKLVMDYQEYKAEPVKPNMETVTDIITNFMCDSEVKTSDQIREHLKTHGLHYDGRAMGPVMRGAIKRNPFIKQHGPGKFVLRGVDE